MNSSLLFAACLLLATDTDLDHGCLDDWQQHGPSWWRQRRRRRGPVCGCGARLLLGHQFRRRRCPGGPAGGERGVGLLPAAHQRPKGARWRLCRRRLPPPCSWQCMLHVRPPPFADLATVPSPSRFRSLQRGWPSPQADVPWLRAAHGRAAVLRNHASVLSQLDGEALASARFEPKQVRLRGAVWDSWLT